MAAGVEAVIAALRVALEEAQKSDETFWRVDAVNRWIEQLPRAWMGRWRRLLLSGDAAGETTRPEFAGHVRAVLAYLEANRDLAPRPRQWWAGRGGATSQPARLPQPASAPVQAAARPVNLLRIRKPMPGVH